MITSHTIEFNNFFTPISYLYGIGVKLRNLLFDWNILKSQSYDLPIINVGNLAVGGTGKTPHTEYIIRLLKDKYRLAVLSRGYKRKTKGFLLAHSKSTSEEIGDEPYQMKRKFPEIIVAVDANRRRGIQNLLDLPKDKKPEVILLDDAYQHRYVKPSLNILLSDYHRLYSRDRLLPTGRLREPAEGAKRADIIVVTKCDSKIRPIDAHVTRRELCFFAFQELFFSKIQYGKLEPVFKDGAPIQSLKELGKNEEILLVSGIASPKPLENEIRKYTKHFKTINYPDHHAFSQKDIQRINKTFKQFSSPNKLIIVTEKDAARLRNLPFIPKEWYSHLYCLPITIGFCLEEEKRFQELIFKHIQSYEQQNRNSDIR